MSKEAMKLALEALETERENYQDWDKQDGAPEYIYEAITALREALAEQPAQQQKEGFASPGGGYVPAIPRPIPLDWKLVPRKATPEMLRAMDECAQEGYDERLYEGMASSVYMAAWDASPVLGTLPPSEKERSMMDIIVGNLVREGINKHRARELAEHFIKHTSPPKSKPWVGLTEEEVWQDDVVMALNAEMGLPMNQIMSLIVWADAKLREKNAQPSKPLTDEQANDIMEKESWGPDAITLNHQLLRTIRRTEAAHGIKGDA